MSHAHPTAAERAEQDSYQQLVVRCRHAIYSIRTGLELIKARRQTVSLTPEVVGMMERESRNLTECMEFLIRQARPNKDSDERPAS